MKRSTKRNLGSAGLALLLTAGMAACGGVSGTDAAQAEGAPAEKASGWGLFSFAEKSEPVVIPAGTRLKVRTTNTLSTAANTAGETFLANLDEPLVIGEKTIAERGAAVTGVITLSDKGGRVKGVAQLGVQLQSLRAANGEEIAIETGAHVVSAKQTHGKDATKIGIGAGVGAVIGAVAGGGSGAAKGAGVGAGAGTGAVLATHGDPAAIPAESSLSFALSSDAQVAL